MAAVDLGPGLEMELENEKRWAGSEWRVYRSIKPQHKFVWNPANSRETLPTYERPPHAAAARSAELHERTTTKAATAGGRKFSATAAAVPAAWEPATSPINIAVCRSPGGEAKIVYVLETASGSVEVVPGPNACREALVRAERAGQIKCTATGNYEIAGVGVRVPPPSSPPPPPASDTLMVNIQLPGGSAPLDSTTGGKCVLGSPAATAAVHGNTAGCSKLAAAGSNEQPPCTPSRVEKPVRAAATNAGRARAARLDPKTMEIDCSYLHNHVEATKSRGGKVKCIVCYKMTGYRCVLCDNKPMCAGKDGCCTFKFHIAGEGRQGARAQQ